MNQENFISIPLGMSCKIRLVIHEQNAVAGLTNRLLARLVRVVLQAFPGSFPGLRIALNEIFPEATYGAIPVIDQYDALEAYLAFDDGALAEAFAAYVTDQQHCAVLGVREMQRPSRPDSNH